MTCYSPLTGYYSRDVGSSGKRGITFDRNSSFSGVALKLPCGQCIGCRLERSRQWAMRCMHEKQLHGENCFITLTYDDQFLPAGGSLVKRDLQLFMKRLRKKVGKVRFYACGEYGERSFRPHYHAILFGYQFPDRRYFKCAPSGHNLYTSKVLSGLWPFGNNVIGDVDFDSCAYVARYIVKKVTGDRAAAHYERYDLTSGEVFNLVPEFTNMSRRPGIGYEWFVKYGHKVYEWDSCIVNGLEVRPPRYYDVKYELIDSDRVRALKVTRRRAAINLYDATPERRRVRETVAAAKLRLKRRTEV